MESRRFLLAAMLSLAVLVAWQWLFPPPPPARVASEELAPAQQLESQAAQGATAGLPTEATSPDESVTPSATRDPGALGASLPAEPVVFAEIERSYELSSESWVARFSNRGAVLESFVLTGVESADGEAVDLIRAREDQVGVFGFTGRAGESLAINDALFVGEQLPGGGLRFRYEGPEGKAEKTFEPAPTGRFSFEAQLEGQDWSLLVGPGVGNPSWSILDDRFQKGDRRATYSLGSTLDEVGSEKNEAPTLVPATGLDWVALEDKYFVTAVEPDITLAAVLSLPVVLSGSEDEGLEDYSIVADRVSEEQEDLPRDQALLFQPTDGRLSGLAYFGTKEYVKLKELGVGLEETVRWGWFGFISKPLLYGLRWLHENVVQNWGWCIVLMTFLIRLVLFPLTHKSYVSMQKLQKLNPKMEAIRAKYRPKMKDKQGRPNFEAQRKMNEEMQELFRAEKVNPAGGCLPILLQMPVFFAFYGLLLHAVELWGAPWIGWIGDLTAPDQYFALPLVMGATQFVQTRMMPSVPNPTQRIIMNTMPIWFTIFAFGFPSGLVLYWLTNNVLTIAQNAGYNRLKKAGFFGGEADDAAPNGRTARAAAKGK